MGSTQHCAEHILNGSIHLVNKYQSPSLNSAREERVVEVEVSLGIVLVACRNHKIAHRNRFAPTPSRVITLSEWAAVATFAFHSFWHPGYPSES